MAPQSSVVFYVSSSVPGYRGETEVASEGRDPPFLYLRDIVDWYCARLGRDALADDDYVLEVQLSTTVSASATPSVSSAHSLSEQVLCQSGSSSSLANVVMTEVQILEPDTELAQLALPAKCHIYILDAQSTLAGDRGTSTPKSFTLSFLQPAFFKTVSPLFYLVLGIILVSMGILFMIVAASKSGSEYFIYDEAVLLSVMLNRTQLSAFNWTRKQFPYSTVQPQLMKVENNNVSLSACLSEGGVNSSIISQFVAEYVHPFLFNEDRSLRLFHANPTLILQYEFQFVWPETYPELVSGLKKAMRESGIEVSGTDVENKTDTPVIEWLDENYKPHPSSGFRQSRYLDKRFPEGEIVNGVLKLTDYSSQIALPYNSTFNANRSELITISLDEKQIGLYASNAKCYGVRTAIERYNFQLWKDSNYSSVVYSGCYANESERTVTLFDLDEFSFCIPNFTTPANISSNTTFTIRGLGSASTCKESLSKVFSYNESKSDNHLVCRRGPGDVCQPKLNASNHFVATGLFFDIAKELNLPVEAAFSTFDVFEKAVRTSCEANSSSSSLNSIALETLCVRSMFTFLLLTESGYGLTNTTWNITFKNASSEREKAVSSESYLVLKSGNFPDNNGVPPLKSSAYAHKTVLISFGIVFLIFGVLSVAVFNHQKKKKRRAAFSYHEFD